METYCVKCVFSEGGGNGYDFRCNLPDVKKGSVLLVDTQNGVSVVRVVGKAKLVPKHATRWAFQKVDMNALTVLKNPPKVAKAETKSTDDGWN